MSNGAVIPHNLRDAPSIRYRIERKSKGMVFFVCDRKACAKCSPDCSHTSNITNAKNFNLFFDESYDSAGFMEIDHNKSDDAVASGGGQSDGGTK